MAGILYLVGTPIGNLEDMTPRGLRVLREVDLIAAEDTRWSLRLLNHFGLKKTLVSYHEHNERERAPELVERLRAGQTVALITDAGLPGISDPGEVLVRAAIAAGITVVPVPGPSACLLALAASGLPVAGFRFVGFLPRGTKERKNALAALAGEANTFVLYESPHRLDKTLTFLRDLLGPERHLTVARELTKAHEEIWQGDLAAAQVRFGGEKPRGEFTLVVAGKKREMEEAVSMEEALSQVDELIERGVSQKEAIRMTAERTGLAKNALYRAQMARRP